MKENPQYGNGFISALQQMQQTIPDVNNALENVEDKLHVLHSLFGRINEVSSHLSTCVKTTTTIKEFSTILSVMPVIGSIATELSQVVKPVHDSLDALQTSLKRIKKALDKLNPALNTTQKGIPPIININNELSDILPKVVKTIEVLDYLLQMADCILPLVEGTSFASSLNTLKNKIDNIENTIRKPVFDVEESLAELKPAIESVANVCREIEQKTEGIKKIISNLKKVVDVLYPIGNALEKVINTIAPIKWVLNAAQCLVKKILEPAINAVMNVTGLTSLINGLQDKLIKMLGFDKLIDEINNLLKNQELENKLSYITSSYEKVSSAYKTLDKNLYKFSPISNKDLGDSLKTMLSELFGAQIDPACPAIIPDWPEEKIIENINSIKLVTKIRPTRFNWNFYINAKNTITPRAYPVYDVHRLCEPNKYLYTRITRKAKKITNLFEQIEDQRQKLCTLICTLEATLILPDQFSVEINSLRGCLDFLSHSVEFTSNISTSELLKKKILHIKDWIEEQKNACDEVCKTISFFNQTLTRYHKYSMSVLLAIQTEDVNKMVAIINSYAEALQNSLMVLI